MAAPGTQSRFVVVVRAPEIPAVRDFRKSVRRRKKKMKTDPSQISRRWNDLPEDVVGEIMVRLSSADRIRFAACCNKFWLLLPNCSRDIDQMPWLVKEYYSPSLTTPLGYAFKLFDPVHQKAYSDHEIIGQDGFYNDDGIKTLACNHGWLLSSWKKQGGTPPTILLTSFLLFSPFTKQIAILPDFDHEYSRSMVAAFSSEPTSPDCVYFVLRQSHDFQKIVICTFQNGDMKWKRVEFNRMYSFDSLVCHEGLFYFVHNNGKIGAYNDRVQQKWSVVSGAEPKITPRNHCRYSYLVVSEGRLVLVYLYVPYNEEISDTCRVFELEKDVWIEKTSLGDKALFLSPCGSFSVSTTSWPLTTRDIANRIYYFRPPSGKKHYYSLGDGKSYQCISRWPGGEVSGIWIQPPQLLAHAAQ